MEYFQPNNLAQYGKPDPTAMKQKQFISEINSEGGAHSSELKKYYSHTNNWRRYLVPATKEERRALIAERLDIDIFLESQQILTIEEAIEAIDYWIKSISIHSLVQFFDNNDVVHKAMVAYKKSNPISNIGMTIEMLAGDIHLFDRKLLKQKKCPQRFWKESRLELDARPCEYTKAEGFSHRADCIQYNIMGTCEWQDTNYKAGVGTQKFQADTKRMDNLLKLAKAKLLTALLKEGYTFEEAFEGIVLKIDWRDPQMLTREDLQELYEFDTDQKAHIKMYFSEYNHTRDKYGNLITSMRDEYIEIDEPEAEKEIKAPKDSFFKKSEAGELTDEEYEMSLMEYDQSSLE
jgi:hypothetical protein